MNKIVIIVCVTLLIAIHWCLFSIWHAPVAFKTEAGVFKSTPKGWIYKPTIEAEEPLLYGIKWIINNTITKEESYDRRKES